MKHLVVSILALLLMGNLQAQEYDPSKVSKKARALYDQALELATSDQLLPAADLLKKAIDTDKKYLDAYLSLAGVYGQLKDYSNSVLFYEKAFTLDTGYTIEYKLPYSINLAGMGEFERALTAINELLDKNPPKNSTSLKAAQYRKRCYEFAVDFAAKHKDDQYVFAPVNAGDLINTADPEYFPSLTIDGKELVFTRVLGHRNEDFFNSHQDETGNWQKAAPMPGSINTDLNEGAQNISQDGQWLVFTACNRRDGLGSCDLYISYLDNNGWSEAINLGGRVNSAQWESQPCLSPDKKELYFASRRPGGYGGSDIYVSRLQPNGRWGDPENLGPGINSSGDEQSPFIHADNQTLYFVSNYWPGYGNDDLFLVRRGPGGDWSKPQNLGYPINTINNDATLFITADGKTAYYASDRAEGKGSLDIYSFELREDVRPIPTLWVRGQVFDIKTKAGLPSTVELTDITNGRIVSALQTDEKGNYLVTLPIGKDYAFNVNRRGYLFYSDNFLLATNAADSTYRKDIPLQPIEANAKFTLNNIFFGVNEYVLQPASKSELDRLVNLLQENPGLTLEISGHTDNVGKPADNVTLSNNRAEAVKKFLVEKGIAATRLQAKGYGETQPVADNNTEQGRAKNRRTEVKVLKP